MSFNLPFLFPISACPVPDLIILAHTPHTSLPTRHNLEMVRCASHSLPTISSFPNKDLICRTDPPHNWVRWSTHTNLINNFRDDHLIFIKPVLVSQGHVASCLYQLSCRYNYFCWYPTQSSSQQRCLSVIQGYFSSQWMSFCRSFDGCWHPTLQKVQYQLFSIFQDILETQLKQITNARISQRHFLKMIIRR